MQAQFCADPADLLRFFQRVDGDDLRFCRQDLFQGCTRDLHQMAHISDGDIVFYHRQCLAEIHTHCADISHLCQCLGDHRVAADLLEHKKVLYAVCIARLLDPACVFHNRVIIQQISVRQNHTCLLPFNAQTHQRLVALHDGL